MDDSWNRSLGTRDWILTYTWIYGSFILLFFLPILAGILRIQTHSCPSCLNEVKQESIFKHLDMDDNIVDLQLGNFAMIIKRRTLFYSLLVTIAAILTYYICRYELSDQTKVVDLTLSWEKFRNEYSGKYSNRPSD